jgi:hypothetical protein
MNVTDNKKGYTASELLKTDFPDPIWVVPGLLPEGVTLACGKPKIGKSFLVLGIALELAYGSKVLSTLEVNPTEVLYLALEDSPRRLKSRIRKMISFARPPDNLHLNPKWQKADKGGLDELNLWLDEHPDVKLVIIDTLERIRPIRKPRGDIYSQDYNAIECLKTIADQRSIAILAVHHLRKGESDDPLEMISGSFGLSGAADTLMVLRRERGRADAFLYVTGRDLEDIEYALKFDPEYTSWEIIGPAHEYKMSEARQEIINYLIAAGQPVRPKHIADALGMNHSTIRGILSKMLRDGQVIQPVDHKYTVNNINS